MLGKDITGRLVGARKHATPDCVPDGPALLRNGTRSIGEVDTPGHEVKKRGKHVQRREETSAYAACHSRAADQLVGEVATSPVDDECE